MPADPGHHTPSLPSSSHEASGRHDAISPTGAFDTQATRAATSGEDAEGARALRRELERSARTVGPSKWNANPEDAQRAVAKLVLTLMEFLRKLLERQAIRRMERRTLTPAEVEAVGVALMRLEETIRQIGERFGLTPEDLNLDLGPLGRLT